MSETVNEQPVSPGGQTENLVQRLRDGESDAANLFQSLYHEALLRFCWGYLGSVEEAEDALQEITYKVLTAPRVPDRLRPWLYRIARNHCLNLRRNRARRKDKAVMPGDSALRASLTGNLTRLVREELREQIVDLVRRLPESHQEVLRLRYVEGLSRAEVAEVLELAESVVKSRLFEGLKKLRTNASLREDS